MNTVAAGKDAMTYVPQETYAASLTTLLAALHPGESSDKRPALVEVDGTRIEIPEPVFDALLDVVSALSRGEGISVVPRSAVLTTQDAADFLGISRPTLVKLLESGDIPFAKYGRHRKVTLADLLDYQDRSRKERSQALDDLVRAGQAQGMYEATDGPPPPMR